MNGRSKLSIEAGSATRGGRERTENQDSLGHAATPLGETWILADGVSSLRAGGRAAEMAVEGILRRLRSATAGGDPSGALREAAERANRDIFERQGAGEAAESDMASTFVAAVVSGREAWIAHAGDSRAYLFRGGRLTPLTRDHSAGGSHVITRALGARPGIEVDVNGPVELAAGDVLVLCSDGLWAVAPGRDIETVLSSGLSAQACADALVDLVKESGGPDDASVHCVRIQGAAGSRPWTFPAELPVRWRHGLAAVAVLAAGLFSWRLATGPIDTEPPLRSEIRTTLPDAPTGTTPARRRPVRAALLLPRWSGQGPARLTAPPEWASRLETSEHARVERIQGDWRSMALMRTTPVFYFKPGARRTAEALRREARLEAEAQVLELPKRDYGSAEGYEVVVVPAAIAWR
jgi:protein phosphatase